jgi:hypothetical protein
LRLFYSILFSFAITLLVINPAVYPVRAGSAAFDQAPSPASMQVNLRLVQDPRTTTLNSLVILAAVTSGGQPVPNAALNFSDSLDSRVCCISVFHNSTASTNSSGIAITEITFVSPNAGNDTIKAAATASGYSEAKGTIVVWVVPYSIQQLAVTAHVVNNAASGGSSEVIQGYAGTVYTATSFWSPVITGVSGVNVTISDGIGSTFPSKTVTTNNLGFYSANFTLGEPTTRVVDIVTVTASRQTYNGSESTIDLAVNPYSPKSLTVSLDSFYPQTYSTVLDSATIQARVSAGGSPVAGIPVVFSDSLGSLFEGPTGITDASGTASTVVYFIYQNVGLDMFTARVSENGSSPGIGSNTLTIRPYGKTQLSVTETMASTNPVAGTADRVTGKVGWVGTSVSYTWSPTQNVISGATVIISDSLGTFAPVKVSTNDAGIYSSTITVTSICDKADVIEASASSAGYRGSVSSVFIVPASSQGQCGATTSSSTTSASTTSATSPASTATVVADTPATGTAQPNLTLTSSTGSIETTLSTTPMVASTPALSDSAAVLLAVVGFVTGTFLVYQIVRVRQKKTRLQ